MAYKLVFRGTKGNTTVEVEDLARTGATCSHCTRGEYPGVCQHCGKLHIRYLAHVKQDLADTLFRATHQDEVENPIEYSDLEVANTGIALLEGKTSKQMDVGCVCVAKYLVDCGVDAGIATRIQENVAKVTHLLQQLAALDAARERVTETVARAAIVRRLHDRHAAIRGVRYNHPKFRANAEVQASWATVSNEAWKEYDSARERFAREAFGLDYFNVHTEENVLRHYDRKQRHIEAKLGIYERGAQYSV